MNVPTFELGQEVWVINKTTQKLPNIVCKVCLGSGFLLNANEDQFKCMYCDGTGEKECHSVAQYVAEKDSVHCVIQYNWHMHTPKTIYKLWKSHKIYSEDEELVTSVMELFDDFYEIYEGWKNVNCQNVKPVANIFATEAEALAKCVELNGATK